MRSLLDEIRTEFDMVLIDCPPNLYLCSWNALLAAEFIVVPFQPEDYGSQGISAIREVLQEVASGPNPNLSLLGYLLTMVQKRLGLHAAFERQLRQLYGSQVFETVIPRSVDFAEAVSARMTVDGWKPRSVAAGSVTSLATEIDRRLEEHRATGQAGLASLDAEGAL
jgi:chromosome partitioning protein